MIVRPLARALLALTLLATLLVACVRTSPPVADEVGGVTMSIAAGQPLAAAELRIRYDPRALAFNGIEAANTGLLVRTFDDAAGDLTIALVSDDIVDGSLLEVAFRALEEGAGEAVAVDRGDAYGRDGAPLPGVLTVEITSQTFAPAGTFTTGADTVDREGLEPLDHDPDASSLETSFATFLLGDVDKSASIDVLDALKVLDIAAGSLTPTAFQLYHSDLDGDDDTDVNDVIRLLDKAVDPTLPADLVVKPSRLSFVQLLEGVPVLIGNAGSQPFSDLDVAPSNGLDASQVAGVTDQAAAFTVSGGFGTLAVSAAGESVTIEIGNLVFLIAGQSNAVGVGNPLSPAEPPIDEVRMLGNDYLWKRATEPLDTPSGQIDTVSADSNAAHSFGVRFGKDLHAATDRSIYLIPSAAGGTSADQWFMGSPLDRGTLFGSANFRAAVSAGEQPNPASGNAHDAEGGPVNALLWYQGEANRNAEIRRADFIAHTNQVMNAFDAQLGVPVIYAQLAASGDNPTKTDEEDVTRHLSIVDIAERQRRMETAAFQGVAAVDSGSGVVVQGPITPRQTFHMVVTHDLPMSDDIHLSAEGQRILGARMALAVREHVLGENVDGTGPRLAGVSRSGNQIRIETTLSLSQDSGNDYEGYFTVFDGFPSGSDIEDSSGYGQNTIPIVDVQRDPADATAILITLQSAPSTAPYVRYAPPYRPFDDTGITPQLLNVVKSSQSGLPLPTFGPLRVD